MGYDLKPVKLRNQWGDGEPIWQRYNMAGWRELNKLIREFKLRPLPQTNDGNLIVEKKCLAIAKIIFENQDRLQVEGLGFLTDHIEWWRNCGGCRVY
jgi:hypothetical protein